MEDSKDPVSANSQVSDQKKSGTKPHLFQPGKSGNPNGRPKIIAEVQALAREYTVDAIKGLAKIAKKGESEAARVAAWNSILDRAWGKPSQALNVAIVPQKMTDEELAAKIAEAEAAEAERAAQA